MPITESMQRLVQDRAPAPELKRLAVAEGMETMRKAALNRRSRVRPSLEEVLPRNRVIAVVRVVQTVPTTCELFTVSTQPSGSATVNQSWMRPWPMAEGASPAVVHAACVATRSSTMRSNPTSAAGGRHGLGGMEHEVRATAQLQNRHLRVLLDRAHAEPGPERGRPGQIGDGNRHMPHPDRRPFRVHTKKFAPPGPDE